AQTPASRYWDFASGISAGAGLELGARSLIGVRVEGTAMQFLSSIGEEVPECVPNRCAARSMASFAAVAAVSGRIRPPSVPIYLMGGADWLYAPRTTESGSSTSAGLNVGLGWAVNRRLALEARYHDPRRDLGLLRSLVGVSLTLRL